MFGIQYLKTPPTVYTIQYQKGKVKRQGAGLSFFYYAPTTSLVAIPTGSMEAPFIFEQLTQDFQQVTVQGVLTFRVAEPEQLAKLLDFTLLRNGDYGSEDPQKLTQRIINCAKVIIQREIKTRVLREALGLLDQLADIVEPQMHENREIRQLGIELLGVAVLAIRPTPDTARALEAETREQVLKEADDALYGRRNASVEQERKVKENELNTEIAVENKRRQIEETKMLAQLALQEQEHKIQEAQRAFEIVQEKKRQELVRLEAENAKAEADVKAYAIKAMMDALATGNPKIVQALANTALAPDQMIANAFQGLADNAQRIGELNISPDLLKQLVRR